MMKKVRWSIHLDGDENGEFYVYDEASDDEIERIAKEYAFNGIDWGWGVVSDAVKERT